MAKRPSQRGRRGTGAGRFSLFGKRAKPSSPRKQSSRSKRPTKRRSAPKRGLIARILRAPFVLIGWIFGLIWRVTWRVSLVGAMIIGLAVVYIASSLPEPQSMVDGRARGSVVLLDRHGEPFAWRGQHFAGVVTVDNASPHLVNAVIATEDKRFRWHPGVDPYSMGRAFWRNYRENGHPLRGQGGSTLTQQTAKLLCFGEAYVPSEWDSEAAYEADCRRTTLRRKIHEALYAMAMELRYTKDEILMIYLNRAYLGAGAQGFAAASERYFDTNVSQLSPAQSAMLAGALTAPSRLAPTSNLERSQGRASVVVGLMQDQGYLTLAQARDALDNPATLSDRARQDRGGYFADWVMGTAPAFLTTNTTEDVIIRTSFDPGLQRAVETGVSKVWAEKVSASSEAEVAVVLMDQNGAVRAMVGGRDVEAQGAFNRATQAVRQTGSAFKPFVYAAAMELGYSPYTRVVDEPITITVPGSGPWRPQNYTRNYAGEVTLERALQQSLNIPAVVISEAMGRENVRRIATDFGIETDLAAGPALALGVSETTLMQMTGAYAGILNGGSSVAPFGITEIRLRGDSEALMGRPGGIGERVISPRAAGYLVWMMEGVVSGGTGARARVPNWEIAGKTGTTQAARDAWFVGFSADYVAGVWMGYDDNTPLKGVTGGGLPAEIFSEVMTRAHAGRTPRPLPSITPPAPAPERARATSPNTRPAPHSNDPSRDRGIGNILRDILGGN